MISIRLERAAWQFDPSARLGRRGGFGEVFRGRGEVGEVAVKRLHLSAAKAAHRELRMAAELMRDGLVHVLQVLDAGQDAESEGYFIVMPLAVESLQVHIDRDGSMVEAAAVDVLSQIATGLAEVEGIVHRDLKPDNVLLHDGKWKLADFGIARFVEESTSTQTLRECLTPAYAAPEQWRLQRASGATDIYALGCIAYSLLSGVPPFGGSPEELQRLHLQAAPPEPPANDPRLRAMVLTTLRKAPESRPSLERVRAVLHALSETTEGTPRREGIGSLEQVAAQEAAFQAEAESERVRVAERRRALQAILADAQRSLHQLGQMLKAAIQGAVSDARIQETREGFEIELRHCKLRFETNVDEYVDGDGELPRSHWKVLGHTAIMIERGGRDASYRGASLVYAQPPQVTGYRWYEISFSRHPMVAGGYLGPIPIADLTEIDRVLGPGMHVHVVRSGPTPIDDEAAEAFCDRWAGYLARAYRGESLDF